MPRLSYWFGFTGGHVAQNRPAPRERLQSLRGQMVERFSLDELRVLSFDVDASWDRLAGETLDAKTIALLEHLNHRLRIPELIDRLHAERPGVVWTLDDLAEAAEPPYRGLAVFREQDAPLFFGRSRLTAELLERLRAHPFLAVVGASGSGKSSVIRAGVMAALKGDAAAAGGRAPDGSHEWAYVTITPTDNPLERLAVALTSDLVTSGETRAIIHDLSDNPATLRLAIRKYLDRLGHPRLFLFVDQFEELYTASKDEAQRRAFIDGLLSAVDAAGPTTLVITLRADFYHHVAQHDGLRQAVEQRQTFIGAPSAVELREAIVEPARRRGYDLEPGLADLMLRDVGDEPGGLPLLSHALLETWTRREGRTMTLAGYNEAGGVRGAIARTAERVYGDLDEAQRETARRILIELAELGEGAEDTRRRLRPEELTGHAWYADAGAEVVEGLVRNRLVTTDGQTIQIAHEALIREWPRLREWLDTDRAGERLRRGLQHAAREWEAHGRDPSYLFEGARLAAAREWDEANPGRLDARGAAFLAEGVAKAEKEEQAAEAAQQRELAQAQALVEEQKGRASAEKRRSRAIRWAALGLATLAVLAALTTVFAISRQLVSLRQSDVAKSRALSIASLDVSRNDPDLALLIAIEAARASETAEAFDAVRSALTATGTELFSLLPIVGVNQATWNADESRILTATDGGIAQVWEAMPDGELLSLRHEGAVFQATWNADESRILTASADDTARVWDATTGEALLKLEHGNWVSQATWNADETRILTAGGDPLPEARDLEYAARVWDASTGEELLALRHDHTVTQATWSADEKHILTASGDGTARIWDAATGVELVSLPHANWVNWAVWNADGSRILTVNGQPGAYKEPGSAARVWDATTGEELLTLPHEDEVYHAIWNADESRILTTSGSFHTGEARVWDATTGQELLKLSPSFTRAGMYPAVGLEAMWNSDESLILVINGEGEGAVFDAVTGEQRPLVPDKWPVAAGPTLLELQHQEEMVAGTWSRDRGRILTASSDGAARVWDPTPGQELLALRHSDAIYQATWSADQRRILTASGDAAARVWDATTGEELLELRQPFGAYMASWNADESRILTAGRDTARVWDSATGALLLELPHEDALTSPLWNSDGSRIVTAGYDGRVRVWDAATGEELLALPHKGIVNWVGWNPDENLIITASHAPDPVAGDSPSVVQLWDATTGEERLTLQHDSWIARVSWKTDGSQFITGGANGITQVWSTAGGKERLKLSQEGLLSPVTWNNDESLILTAIRWGPAIIRDAVTGERVMTLAGDGTPVVDAHWSADGRRVLIATEGGQVSIHYTQMEDLNNAACNRLDSNMTWAAWQQYFPGERYRLTCPNLSIPLDVPEAQQLWLFP